jgi:hypothetical protein
MPAASIDDRAPVVLSGASDDRVYQSLLFSVEGLDAAKEHIIVSGSGSPVYQRCTGWCGQTLTNLPSASMMRAPGADCWLDIDYIVVQQPA